MHVVRLGPTPLPVTYICTRCKLEKPKVDFWLRPNGNVRQRLCKACSKRGMLSPEKLKATRGRDHVYNQSEIARRRVQRYDHKRRIMLDKLKNKPCLDCGNTFPPECMDFDHVRDRKVSNVGSLRRNSWRVIFDEIAKCDLVCANCHRIRTKRRLKLKPLAKGDAIHTEHSPSQSPTDGDSFQCDVVTDSAEREHSVAGLI